MTPRRTYFEKESKRFIDINDNKLKARIEKEIRQKARPSTPALRDIRDLAHDRIQPIFEEFWEVSQNIFLFDYQEITYFIRNPGNHIFPNYYELPLR